MSGSTVTQPWRKWYDIEMRAPRQVQSGSGSKSGSAWGEHEQKPWLDWQPTPRDPSVKPWLSWNACMDNGDVGGDENRRVITHVMGACSSFAGVKK